MVKGRKTESDFKLGTMNDVGMLNAFLHRSHSLMSGDNRRRKGERKRNSDNAEADSGRKVSRTTQKTWKIL